MRIAIVGGGLAGLAAAAGLKRQGLEADVFERAPALGEVGAGVQISPNAIKALDAVGVGDAIRMVGNQRKWSYWLDLVTGNILNRVRHDGYEGRYGAPYYAFHRADLISALASGSDRHRLHTNHELASIVEERDTVVLSFTNGRTYEADAVIGADGVRSVVRKYLWGEDAPIYTGQMIWRAIIPGSSVDIDMLKADTGGVWLGPGAHLIIYHLRGEDIINVGIRTGASEWIGEDWSIPGDPETMRRQFKEVAEPRVQAVLARITSCHKWGLFARNPSPVWGRGRIQLIGDAAHPMLPDAAQGASQAFEDAYTISRWLASEPGDPESAFAEFEKIRKPRAHAVQLQSASNTRTFHASGPLVKIQQHALMGMKDEPDRVPENFDWIYRHDPVASWSTPPTVPKFPSASVLALSSEGR